MNTCRVCAHPDRYDIETELMTGKPVRYVAQNYNLSYHSVQRHKRNHLSRAVLTGIRARKSAHNLSLTEQLKASLDRINKLFDACDEALADPDRPGRYDLSPRAADISVRYTARDAGGSRRSARAPLSDLLERAEAGLPADARVHAVHLRAADPRELLLKTARQLQSELQFVARLAGGIDEAAPAPTVNVLIASPEWINTRTAMLRALEPYPDARFAVIEALRNASALASQEGTAA
jgi:hypothetical protein